MKKIVFIIICIISGVIIGGKVLGAKNTPPPALPAKEISHESGTASQTKGILPTKIRIPKIDVNSVVESVAMDAKGRMDVPSVDENTAWYNLGFKPGDMGSAVIDGHFDTVSGSPAVFYRLSELKPGDEIIVSDTTGKELTFKVTESHLYPDDDFPLQKVFNTTDQPRLNLITCDGVWDSKAHSYSQRLVVFSILSS